MKKSIFLLLLVTGIIMLPACKQDFDVTADYKELPVVYGLLNPSDNVHYLRIQKGYLLDSDAYPAAGVTDSIYYSDSIVVQLKQLPNGPTFTLQKVDGNLETPPIPKEGGTFANTPNILYKFTGNLVADKQYQLTLTRADGNEVIASSTTTLIKDFVISFPTAGDKIELRTTQPYGIVYWSTAKNGGIYDITMRFNYKEYDNQTNALLKDTFADIVLIKSFITGAGEADLAQTTDLNGEYILRSIGKGVPVNPSVYRVFDAGKGLQFTFGVGGVEFASYISSKLAQSGLTSNEALPPFTNISNGVGVFSSRYFKAVNGVLLGDKTLDTLSCNVNTRELRFKNSLGGFCQ
jgi:hypothetical protein